MIDSAPSICGSPPRNACLRQRPRAQWAPEGLWETRLIDNCLLERQRGGGGGGQRQRRERRERERGRGGMAWERRDRGERWVTGGRGGVGGLGRWSEIEEGIAPISSSLSSPPLPAPLPPSPWVAHLATPASTSTSRRCTAPLCSTPEEEG